MGQQFSFGNHRYCRHRRIKFELERSPFDQFIWERPQLFLWSRLGRSETLSMKCLVYLTDSSKQHMVLITLPEEEARKAAVDVIFDLVGSDSPEEMVKENVISEAQLPDLKALKQLIFDRDNQGLFIRDGLNFTANGKDLNPELPFEKAFVPGELDGTKYLRCDLQLASVSLANNPTNAKAPPQQASQEDQMQIFARTMF